MNSWGIHELYLKAPNRNLTGDIYEHGDLGPFL